jgi:hypothetical protein
MYNGPRKIFIATLCCLGVLVFFEATTRGVLWSYAGFGLIVRGHDDTAWRLSYSIHSLIRNALKLGGI